MTTPHRVGQVTKAEILIADRLETWGLTEPNERAAWLVQRLQTELGWAPPRSAADDAPPPPSSSHAQHRAACMAQIRAALNRTQPAVDAPILDQTRPNTHTL